MVCAVQATSHYLKQCWLVYWCINASLGLNEINNASLISARDRFSLYLVKYVEWWVHAATWLSAIAFCYTESLLYFIISMYFIASDQIIFLFYNRKAWDNYICTELMSITQVTYFLFQNEFYTSVCHVFYTCWWCAIELCIWVTTKLECKI